VAKEEEKSTVNRGKGIAVGIGPAKKKKKKGEERSLSSCAHGVVEYRKAGCRSRREKDSPSFTKRRIRSSVRSLRRSSGKGKKEKKARFFPGRDEEKNGASCLHSARFIL